MFTKATLGFAVILATASGALTATKIHITAVRDAVHAAYNAPGSYTRLDDCLHVAFPQCDGNAGQTQVRRS